MSFSRQMISLGDACLHPPSLDDGDAQGKGQIPIPWVLLEDTAYVADRRNGTTAYSDSNMFGAQIQVTCCFARPPRVSYLCVSCTRRPAGAKEEEVIAVEPQVLSTDANLVLLRIALSPDKDRIFEPDLYVYCPAGHGGPSLTLLHRPPGDRVFDTNQIGILSSRSPHTNHYMVAALIDGYDDWLDWSGSGRGDFLLYLYDSKHGSWTTHTLSVEDQQLHKHQDQEGYFEHDNAKVIAIGGKHGTMGFVDLWRGILLCDLLQVKDSPTLRYIDLPPRLQPDTPIPGDARLSRDIAVVEDRIRYVQHQTIWRPCPIYKDKYIRDGWMAATWSRLITSPVEDPWEIHHIVKSCELDISNPQFELLPRMHDKLGKTLQPFKSLCICQPTLSLRPGDATVCFMAKMHMMDAKAWVIDVDMSNSKLQGVVEFDATKSACVGFAYLHSGISKYLERPSGAKGKLKRRGGLLLPGPSNKKQPGILKPMQQRGVVVEKIKMMLKWKAA